MGGWFTLSAVLPMVVNQYYKTDRYNSKFWCYEQCLFCLCVKYFINNVATVNSLKLPTLFGQIIYKFNWHLIMNYLFLCI